MTPSDALPCNASQLVLWGAGTPRTLQDGTPVLSESAAIVTHLAGTQDLPLTEALSAYVVRHADREACGAAVAANGWPARAPGA